MGSEANAGFVFRQKAPETLFLTAEASAAIRPLRLSESLPTSTPGVRRPANLPACQIIHLRAALRGGEQRPEARPNHRVRSTDIALWR